MNQAEVSDFTRLSTRSTKFGRKYIHAANGATFIALDMNEEEILSATFAVYLLVHRDSKLSYIGQSKKKCGVRWGSGNGYKKVHQPKLRNAIEKYGWESFDKHILALCDRPVDLDRVEIECIKAIGGHGSASVLNLAPGGRVTVDRSEPIIGVNLKTGEVRRFKSAVDAAEQISIKKPGNIRQVVRQQTRSASGWWFKPAESEAQPPKKWGLGSGEQYRRELVVTRLSDGQSTRFDSITGAAVFVKGHSSNLTRAAKAGGGVCNGYWVQYANQSTGVPKMVGRARGALKNGKPVLAINHNSGEVMHFHSGHAAARYIGADPKNVPRACRGGIKSLAGWKLRYLESEAREDEVSK
jgi:hypothetical protein